MRRIWIDTLMVDGGYVSATGVLRAQAPEKLVAYYAKTAPAQSAMDDASADEHADVAAGRVVERMHHGQWRLEDLQAAAAAPFDTLKDILLATADELQAEI